MTVAPVDASLRPQLGRATGSLPARPSFGRRYARHRLGVIGAAALVILGLGALLAPLIAPFPPNPTLTAKVLAQARQSPSWCHLFGTDELGRDVFTRVLYGGRMSLTIGLCVALASTALGTAVGAVAGWFGGVVDQLLMRITDLLMIIPGLAVLMIAQKGLGGSMTVIIAVLSLLSWHIIARVVRAEFRRMKALEFVEAARASGARAWRIMAFELLPNTVGVLAVNAALAVGGAILGESALSFLGFGLTPPAASWGSMLSQSKGAVGTRLAYLVYFPGLAILLTVLAVNFVGNALRDAFDPAS